MSPLAPQNTDTIIEITDEEDHLAGTPHAAHFVQHPIQRRRFSGKVERVLAQRAIIEVDFGMADGQLLVCEPAASLPMTQRYFLF